MIASITFATLVVAFLMAYAVAMVLLVLFLEGLI